MTDAEKVLKYLIDKTKGSASRNVIIEDADYSRLKGMGSDDVLEAVKELQGEHLLTYVKILDTPRLDIDLEREAFAYFRHKKDEKIEKAENIVSTVIDKSLSIIAIIISAISLYISCTK